MMIKGRTWLFIGMAGAAVSCGLILGVRQLSRGRGAAPVRQASSDSTGRVARPMQAGSPESQPSTPGELVLPLPGLPRPEDRSVQPPPSYKTPVGDAPAFRLSAMTKRGERISVGIVDRKTGHGRMLRPGESSADGWRLVSVQFDEETAVFEKDGREYTAPMERGEANLFAADLPDGSSAPDGAVVSVPPATPRRATEPQAAFSNRVYEVEGLEPVAVNAVPGNLNILEIKTGGETFAMRREIVENILQVERLSTEDKMWMLISFPGLVEVQPGEDPTALTEQSEEEMAKILVPPTNAPPLEDLNRAVENFKNIHPPDLNPPKP